MANLLTELEMRVIELCLNYSDREGQLSDNFSNAGHADITELICDGNKQAASALIGSLEKKGYAHWEDLSNGEILWLTEDGVNAYFDQKEKEAPEPMKVNCSKRSLAVYEYSGKYSSQKEENPNDILATIKTQIRKMNPNASIMMFGKNVEFYPNVPWWEMEWGAVATTNETILETVHIQMPKND